MRSKLVAALFLSVFIVTGFSMRAVAGGQPETLRLVEILKGKGVLTDADYAGLMAPASPSDDHALNRRLIKVLYEKGVLDEGSFTELASMSGMELGGTGAVVPATSQEAAAKASPAEPSARTAVPAVDKALSAIETGIAKVGRDEVSMKINFFLQAGWLNDDAGFSVGSPPTSDISLTAGNQFFLRRVRLYLGGNVTDRIGYKFSLDPTTTSPFLKDAYVTLDYIPYARMTFGQFKVPFGYEGPFALAEMPVANRSMVTNMVHTPTLRDRGVMLSGKYNIRKGEDPLMASYDLALVNGTGDNRVDDNDSKDVSARVRFNPMLPCITLGGSYYAGQSYNAGRGRHKERWGAEVEFLPKHVKGLKFLGEYVWATQYFDTYASKNVTDTTGLPALASHANQQGWYVLGAYRLNGFDGSLKFLNGLEPAARYEFLDEDTHVGNNARTKTTIGLNYYFAKDTRFMVNYEMVDADGQLQTQSLQKIDTISHNVLTTLMQVKF